MREGWHCYSLNHQNPSKDVPIILIERGPQNIAEIKRAVRKSSTCIVFFEEKSTLFFKSSDKNHTITLENDSEYQRIASILRSTDMADAQDKIDLQLAVESLINKIPSATRDFVNRGLFSTHYLRSRIFGDTRQNVDAKLGDVKNAIGDTKRMLQALGWNVSNQQGSYFDGMVSITITKQDDFGIRERDEDVAPAYTAVATLRSVQWAILTNGRRWRLYSSRVSSSSTNYFEIVLDPEYDSITRYLVILFGAWSFAPKNETTDVNTFFDEGKNYGRTVETNLSARIMNSNGLFLDIVKGVLGHDMKKTFSSTELEDAKRTSLKIMYRIWFVAYAESRNLLPVRDEKYIPISLQDIRRRLDFFENDPNSDGCWKALIGLFGGIRNGSSEHNLPQYNGDLFKHDPAVDSASIKNEFIVKALYGLLEDEGFAIDYADFSVRHLGNIFETLMEYSPRQTDKDIMLLEDSKGIREVNTRKDATYSYNKNDLYLASKGGIISRKTSASFYTPDEIVKFLVDQGLNQIFAGREKLIRADIRRYKKSKSRKDMQTCMDRILDIQVLDPTMGSGHFLVEALNRITLWATGILEQHADHPLLYEIELDRRMAIEEQRNKGIMIDESVLTADVLLKRKIMKRCIFGVDLNPMAVDLAKLSLWLDSFAIGMPLTYMDHHLKTGDSTIGSFMDDMKDKENTTLDDWSPGAEANKMICDIASSSDITVEQVHASEDLYLEHRKSLEPARRILNALTASKINSKILPKKSANEFIHKFGRYSKTEPAEFTQARKTVNELAERHHFFHWEIEMMDAFVGARKGFDLIIGNPPWDKVKASDDEFFSLYDPVFKSLKLKTKKKKIAEQILKSTTISKKYEAYKNRYKEQSSFYSTYDLQGAGDKDLWKLVLERSLGMVSKNGVISMLVPSQFVSNVGGVDLRKSILKKEILSLYVLTNNKKIFPIISSYRFVLLSVRNNAGPDKFPAGFYLHCLQSLDDSTREKEKFGTLTKSRIIESSPDEYIIPEIVGKELDLLVKMSQNNSMETGIGDGWSMNLTSGFHKTNDADLLMENGKGWPVHEGKTIHQYNPQWSHHEFTAYQKSGLERESKKRVFTGKRIGHYNSYRLVFRNIARSADLRTTIAAVIPPHTFYTYSLRSFVLEHDGKIRTDLEYNAKISYLCGVLNSLCFDFASRAKIQVNLSTIIKSLPFPSPIHEKRISKLAAMMTVGTASSPDFEGFAGSMRIPNVPLTPAQRIETAAEIDALVAHSYGLTSDEYQTVIDSFPAFKRNSELYDLNEIKWDNKNLKEFYGEMADLALEYFEDTS